MTISEGSSSDVGASTDPGVKLARTLGVGEIVFMVVAMAAPLTVVVGLIPLMIATGNGLGVALDYGVAGAVLLLFTVGFTAMGAEVNNAGAFYAYIQRGLGRIVGLGAAALAIVTYIMLMSSVVAYLGAAIRNVVTQYSGVATPWWLWATASLVLIAYLGYRNVQFSAKVLVILLGAEVLIVAVFNAVILVQGGDDGLSLEPFAPSNFTSGAIGTGIMFAFFGFIGFEVTAAFRSEAKDPERTIPRATYIAVATIIVIYATSAYATIIGSGTRNTIELATKDPENFTLNLAERYLGSFSYDAMQFLLVTSFFACVLTVHNVVTRYFYALGSLRVLPGRLGHVHASHKSPHVASVVSTVFALLSVVVAAGAGLDPVVDVYGKISGAGTLGLLSLLVLTSLAVVVHFRNTSRELSFWVRVIAPTLALLGLVVAIILTLINFEALIGSRPVAIALLVVLALSFIVGMLWALRLRSTKNPIYDGLFAED